MKTLTAKTATQIINETNSKEIIFDILKKLNGESYADAKKILEVVNFYLSRHSYIDNEMAQSIINAELENDD